MKTKRGCWALIALTLSAGCIPSLNSVYTVQQLVFDPNKERSNIENNTG